MKKNISAFACVNTVLMLLFAVFAFYPLYNIYIYSFNDGLDSMRGTLYLWPRIFSLDNFKVAFTQRGIFNAFRVSIARTVFGTLLTLICTSSMAYAMTKRRIPGYRFFFDVLFHNVYFQRRPDPVFLDDQDAQALQHLLDHDTPRHL